MLRLAANKKGLHLSNTGLTDAANGTELLIPTCEEDIISYLGFPIILQKLINMSKLILCDSQTYAIQEVNKLRALYEAALQYRIDCKKKMREIVLH